MVALGRFSCAHDSPVVPDWTAICMPLALSWSCVVAAEPFFTTMDWLESR